MTDLVPTRSAWKSDPLGRDEIGSGHEDRLEVSEIRPHPLYSNYGMLNIGRNANHRLLFADLGAHRMVRVQRRAYPRFFFLMGLAVAKALCRDPHPYSLFRETVQPLLNPCFSFAVGSPLVAPLSITPRGQYGSFGIAIPAVD